MPEYKYKCKTCDYKFSIVVSIVNKIPDVLIQCPNCKKAGQVKRVWENFSFILKGKGFFKTDQRNIKEE